MDERSLAKAAPERRRRRDEPRGRPAQRAQRADDHRRRRREEEPTQPRALPRVVGAQAPRELARAVAMRARHEDLRTGRRSRADSRCAGAGLGGSSVTTEIFPRAPSIASRIAGGAPSSDATTVRNHLVTSSDEGPADDPASARNWAVWSEDGGSEAAFSPVSAAPPLDAPALGSTVARREGSSPSPCTPRASRS